METKLKKFSEKEACDFIERYINMPADEYFKKLAKKMGYMPLALDYAGVFMRINQKSYREYLNLYNKKNVALVKKYKDDPDIATLATALLILFESIDKPAAKELLILCSFFAPDNINCKWFMKASDILPKQLREAVSDEMTCNDIINELILYSLVSINEDALCVHSHVQEIIRNSLEQDVIIWRNLCISILNELCYEDFSTDESKTLFCIISPHIVSVTHGMKDEDATEGLAWLYHFLGSGHDELADYPQALEYYGKALDIFEMVHGKVHWDTAATCNDIALVFDKQGDYDPALEYFEQALEIYEKVLEKEHSLIGTTYNNIGVVYEKRGDYDRALEYHEKAKDIREKALGTAHPHTATTYNNIAEVYRAQGKYDLALIYHEKALSIREKVLGKEHHDTATTYNNIAVVYHEQSKYDCALEWYLKASSVLIKVLGYEHPITETVIDNMADAYEDSGRLEPFDKWMEKKLPE